MKTKIALLIVPLILAAGCATSGAAKIVKALSNDRAKVTIDVNGWGASVHFERDGTANTNAPAK